MGVLKLTIEEKLKRLTSLGYEVNLWITEEGVSITTYHSVNETSYKNTQDANTLSKALKLIAERNVCPIRIDYK